MLTIGTNKKSLRPPLGFKPLPRPVKAARFCGSPFTRTKRYTKARAAGVRYERKAHTYLTRLYPDAYIASPWIKYTLVNNLQWKWCQPDGLLVFPRTGRVILIEIKNSHTPLAWWQLKRLYAPVIKAIFPPHLWSYDFCEVTRFYDCSVRFPEAIQLARYPDIHAEKFKVHIFKP